MTEHVIDVDAVTIRYPNVVAASDVSLSVEAGGVYALLGRSGAGKSSLMRILVGQQKPARGCARILEQDCWKRRKQLMDEVGYVAEEPTPPAGMTASRLHSLCSRLHATWDSKEAFEILERFEVPMGTEVQRLSRGQIRGLMFSLALGFRPRVLVLDEPTLGLDPFARRVVLQEVIVSLADRGITVLLASQDLDVIEGLASRIGILHEGVLLLDETLEELKGRYRRLNFSSTDGAPPPGFLVQESKRHPWGTEAIVSDFEPSKLDRLREGSGSAKVEESSVSLEEIFLSVTTRTSEKGRAA
jgi:ABC-2 type transport system ATP-binding protein